MAEHYITQRSQSGKLLTTCNIQIGKKNLQISRDKLNLHGLKRPLSHIPILIWRSIGKKSSFFPLENWVSTMTQVPSVSQMSRLLSPLIEIWRWWMIFNTTDCNKWRKNSSRTATRFTCCWIISRRTGRA